MGHDDNIPNGPFNGRTEQEWNSIGDNILYKVKSNPYLSLKTSDIIIDSNFESNLKFAIIDELKRLNMDSKQACIYTPVSVESPRIEDYIKIYFESSEEAQRFSGWYSAILGFFKESARNKIIERR